MSGTCRVAPLSIAAMIASASGGASAVHAQTADTVRGRIARPTGGPIAGAAVRVTPAGGNAVRQLQSDTAGRFTTIFDPGAGTYDILITAVGFSPEQRRVQRDSTRPGSRLIDVDVRMREAVIRLETVKIRPEREKPRERDARASGTGTFDTRLTGLSPASGDLGGDLASTLGTLPGVMALPSGGFSVLGLDPSANGITIGGMLFTGAALPRDLGAGITVSSASADASRSGFAGAGVAISPAIYEDWNALIRATLDHPALQATPATSGVSSRVFDALASGLVTRSLNDRLRLNVFWQGERRVSDRLPLGGAGPAALRAAGIAPDSAARVLAAARTMGVEGAADAVTESRTTSGRAFATLNYEHSPATSFTAFVNGSLDRGESVPASPWTAASRGAGDRGGSIWLNTSASHYLSGPVLNVSRLMVSRTQRSLLPKSSMPAADIRVASDVGEWNPTVGMVGLGGAAWQETRSATWDVEARNEVTWFSLDARHRLLVTADALLEGYSTRPAAAPIASFRFASIEDFANNRPASFNRTFPAGARGGRVVTANASATDAWRSALGEFALRINAGANVEGTAFLDAPAANPDIERLFGIRPDRTPSSASISPRFGFTLRRGRTPDAFRTAPGDPFVRSELYGTAGEYRARLPAATLDPAYASTESDRQISCVGAATPAVDWRLFQRDPSTIPDACVMGAELPVLADQAPSRVLFAPGFGPTRSRRVTLGWSGKLSPHFIEKFEISYSNTLGLPSSRDLNFDPRPRFVLGAEGGRPVFVEPSSIVAATGASTVSDSRRVRGYSRVLERASDLRSHTLQFQAQASRFIGAGTNASIVAFAYTYLAGRTQQRGFTGSTGGNPGEAEWVPLAASGRHELNMSLQTVTWGERLTLAAVARLTNGLRYTPIVAGDVNGDGLANDRAFVFDPSRVADADVALSMRSLLEAAPAAARDCLRRELGKIAGAFGCSGPWASALNISAFYEPRRLNMPSRGKIGVTLVNALAAADVLMHGSRDARGWGQFPQPDPVLLNVRGFDPATQTYRYDVNPRFGASLSRASAGWAPFRLALEAVIDLGTNESRPYVLSLLFEKRGASTGSRATDSLIVQRLAAAPSILTSAVTGRFAATLGLNEQQRLLLADVQRRALDRDRAIFAPVAKHLVGVSIDNLNVDDALRRLRDAFRLSGDNYASATEELLGILSKDQLSRITPVDRRFFDPEWERAFRASYPGIVKVM